jgi:hypothetical protein
MSNDVRSLRREAIAKLACSRRNWPVGTMSRSAMYDLVVDTGGEHPVRAIIVGALPRRANNRYAALYVTEDMERVYWIPQGEVAQQSNLEDFSLQPIET